MADATGERDTHAARTTAARDAYSSGFRCLQIRPEFAEGRIVLSQKLEEFTPHVVAFNGKLTFEQFAQRRCKYGIQKELLYGARVYVLPSTSGANNEFKDEKLLHFRKLAKLVAKVEKAREIGAP